jgi:16S rRNA (uracil1498-N3)-methyltransferase
VAIPSSNQYNINHMHRFYIERVNGDTVSITDAGQLHHLKDVLRLKVTDGVVIFDSDGNEYAGIISVIERKQAVIKVTALKPARRNQMKLTIACAIPKGDRMDDIIDQLTQLGVARIIPMATERVVVKLDDARKEARLKRWRTIARNAALQSQRNTLPLIEPVTDVADVVSQYQDYDLKLIPNLEGERRFIKDVLADAVPEKILILIGPEGDFTPEEVELALGAGFIPVSLGDTVLRVATAAVAVASYIKFALGE